MHAKDAGDKTDSGAPPKQHALPPHQFFSYKMKRNSAEVVLVCMCTKLPTIQFLHKAPSPSIMGINLQISQRQKASCGRIGELDEEDSDNSGEAGCEK